MISYMRFLCLHICQSVRRKLALNTLGEYLNDDGILVVTIRPVEYWELRKDLNNRDALVDAHRTEGFAFRPHNRASVDGDITYGDTSMTGRLVAKEFSSISYIEDRLLFE